MNKLADHIVSGYDADLNDLNAKLSQMGSLAETMLSDVIRSLKKRDNELAEAVIAADSQVNRFQEEIDEDALRIVALRHPMASDLRRVMGAVRVANDMERVGDLAEGIAWRTLSLNEVDRLSLAKGVARMGKMVKGQLSQALDALLREDTDLAVQIWLADEDVDEMYNSIFRELLTYMMADPRTITASASLLFIAKNMERIGDLATNICESIYFTVNGTQLIRDHRVEKARKNGK
ncbi:PhoU-like phosphate uptake regulator [Litorimonas taeanensis]|uniref:Phosphate-specific transport system accessory protein PhoU n=2 Tax=Litorimonas taeanensis TaxID=568099 RepID=A0A420WDI9_9PROT|nr:PhoU-like phosphate uptake regulator [Litorimonas taeanensis]